MSNIELKYEPTDEDKKVIQIMRDEKTEWEEGQVWATDKVHYKMRDIIQKARKNYLGKFDVETDEVTGRKKYFVPLTEDMTETVVKNIDLDTLDINIRSTNPNGYASSNILRYLISYFMRKNYWGEILNEMLRLFCIDGTVILKNLKNYDKKLNRQVIKSRIVDRTNFIIDPSEDNIQEAGAVIERNVLRKSEIEKYPWKNVEYVSETTSFNRLNTLIGAEVKTQVPYVEVFERWGELPIGKDGKWVSAVAIVSDLDANPVVHLVKENKKGIKPYEECRYRKLFGRWDGRGIGEMLIPLQRYLNETVNLRINAARIAQLGLFKVRKGSGITRQLLKSLISGGAIPVTRMEDIAELRVPDIKESSYRDEETTYNWAQKVTGAFDVSRGEGLPASQPATTAMLQEKGSKSGFNLIQENLGMFLSRVFERHIIPLLIENLKMDDVISIVGSPKELKELDNNYINKKTKDYYINSMKKGKLPSGEDVAMFKDLQQQMLSKFGKNRYLSDLKKVLSGWEYEVQIFVTKESFNKAVIVEQLNSLLLNYSQVPGISLDQDAIIKEILDLMGIGGARFLESKQEGAVPNIQGGQGGQGGQPRKAQPMRPEVEMVGEAVTREKVGK